MKYFVEFCPVENPQMRGRVPVSTEAEAIALVQRCKDEDRRKSQTGKWEYRIAELDEWSIPPVIAPQGREVERVGDRYRWLRILLGFIVGVLFGLVLVTKYLP